MVLVSHSLEIEPCIVVMASLATIGDSLRLMSKVTNVLQKSNAAAERIFEVLDMPMERIAIRNTNENSLAVDNSRIVSGRQIARIKLPNHTLA